MTGRDDKLAEYHLRKAVALDPEAAALYALGRHFDVREQK